MTYTPTERDIILQEAKAAGMTVNEEEGTIELFPISRWDSPFTELAGKQMVFQFPDMPWFRFERTYLAMGNPEWEKPIYFHWYIPMPHSNEDLKSWLRDILDHRGMSHNLEIS